MCVCVCVCVQRWYIVAKLEDSYTALCKFILLDRVQIRCPLRWNVLENLRLTCHCYLVTSLNSCLLFRHDGSFRQLLRYRIRYW